MISQSPVFPHFNPVPSKFLAIFILVLAVFFLLKLAIKICVCLFLSSCLARLPEPYRKQKPGMVWLLLIPFFSLVWNFFVDPEIANSFRSYYGARGKNGVDDCGYALALAYCICAVSGLALWIVPLLAGAGAVATLVLWILVLVKFSSLKAQIGFDAVPRPAMPLGAVCPKCGTAAAPGVKFCGACGSPVAVPESAEPVCQSCGAKQDRGAKYCPRCGKPLQP
jgi:hypothetical protein